MKKLILMSALAISGLMNQTANAQIGVHFNINLGPRPVVVAPAPVYAEDYYYLPEVEAYYSVNQHCYYYQDGGRWITATYLPGRYHDYDWRSSSHYAVREARPYLHNDVYRARYGGWEGRRDWNRDVRSTRVYADKERFDNHGNYGRNDNRQNDNHGGYGNRNDNRQNDNRGGYGNRNQPQQNNNRDNHNDNNRGGNDGGRQGRMGRG